MEAGRVEVGANLRLTKQDGVLQGARYLGAIEPTPQNQKGPLGNFAEMGLKDRFCSRPSGLPPTGIPPP